MANYRNILLAVDFTPESEQITRRGRELAEQMAARVNLIHVVEYSSAMYPADVPLPEEVNLDERLIEQAEVKLKELAITHSLPNAHRVVVQGIPKRKNF